MILNLSDQTQGDYRLETGFADPVCPAEPELLLHTDWESFGGSTPETAVIWKKEQESLLLTLPPYSGILVSL